MLSGGASSDVEWATVVPTMVGGGLAIVGGIVSGLLVAWRSRANEYDSWARSARLTAHNAYVLAWEETYRAADERNPDVADPSHANTALEKLESARNCLTSLSLVCTAQSGQAANESFHALALKVIEGREDEEHLIWVLDSQEEYVRTARNDLRLPAIPSHEG